jgi:flagellar biosynthesis/type III secretory pathway protein FliH
VKAFNKEPENAMDEWMDYLKNERIRQDTEVPGLQEAKRRLDYLKMTVAEQKIYDNYLYNKFYREDVLNTSRTKGVVEGYHEGKEEGLQEGLEKGRAEGLQEGLEKGRAEGRAEGLQEGLEKGRAEGLKEAAAKMKRLGISPEQISQSTGIPLGEAQVE